MLHETSGTVCDILMAQVKGTGDPKLDLPMMPGAAAMDKSNATVGDLPTGEIVV